MAAVTIRSDFGAQENKICHCFHFYPIYLCDVMGLNIAIIQKKKNKPITLMSLKKTLI